MEILKFVLAWCVLQVLLVLVSSAAGFKTILYKDKDFSDPLLELRLTDECYNIPSDIQIPVYSLRTFDCFITYSGADCNGDWSAKYIGDRHPYTHKPTGHHTEILSLQKCNSTEGGATLNVDITTHFGSSSPSTITNVLENYYDVCGCVNVPEHVQNMSMWSIDNHANGLFAYFESNCGELHVKPLYIAAGHSKNSRDMHMHTRENNGTLMKIQSFGPAPNSTYSEISCTAYYNDRIMKIELLEVLNSSYRGIHENLYEAGIEITSSANDDLVHFFADANFEGFRFSSRSASKCNNFIKNIERRWVNGIGSIKTKTCVFLYNKYDCGGRSIKIEAPGSSNLTTVWESTTTGENTLSLLYSKNPNWKWETISYHICHKEEEGSSINVEIYSDDPKVLSQYPDGPIILENYSDLCACRNVPEYVQELNKWSVNNYGNAMMAYFSPECSSSKYTPLWIPAADSSYSFGLGIFKVTDQSTGIVNKIQSFGPDPNSEYYAKTCNKNCTLVSSFRNINTTKVTIRNICDFEAKNECMQIAMLNLESMQVYEAKFQDLIEEIQTLSKKVKELRPFHEQAFENATIDLNEKP